MTHPKQLLSMLPKPTGYRLVLAIPKKDAKSEGGIVLPEQMVKREQTASIIGYVMAMGPLAYQSKERFPDGIPWCKVDDFVLFKTYAGARFSIRDQEFRIINDDMVDAVVPDPTVIERL